MGLYKITDEDGRPDIRISIKKKLERQLRERVIDYNSKGEVRMRFKDDSPCNDKKEEKLLRDILLQRKEPSFRRRTHSEKILEDFIKSNIKWMDKHTAKSALQGNDSDIKEALNQIHRGSLVRDDRKSIKIYKEVLLEAEG